MAHKRIRYNDKPSDLKEICEYQVETPADINSLPTETSAGDKCSAGSTCIVENPFSVYILSVDGVTWVPLG